MARGTSVDDLDDDTAIYRIVGGGAVRPQIVNAVASTAIDRGARGSLVAWGGSLAAICGAREALV